MLSVSKHKVSNSRQSCVASLQCQSLRWRAIFLCCRETARLARYQPLDLKTLRLKSLIQCFQLIQGLFQKLRRTYLATIRTGEKRFQSEVKPCALTCLGKPRFGIVNAFTTEAYPVISTIVTLDSYCFDVACYYHDVDGKKNTYQCS